jgi:hypothetical protein
MTQKPKQPPNLTVRRDSSESPFFRTVAQVQRRRMILDVAAADLEAAESLLGPVHPTAWHFRQALTEAQNAWEQLRAQLGGDTLKSALAHPPVACLTLGVEKPEGPQATLIPIGGETYRAERVPGTSLAPMQWRLTHLGKSDDVDPYYVCRLRDGSTQCDCADWTFRVLDAETPRQCKHLSALKALGWL